MKILVLGDIVGRPGRKFLTEQLFNYRKKESVSFCIANGENAAGGAGITAKTAEEIKKAGVDAITLGDHVWDQKNFENEINQLNFICRPANLPCSNPGRDHLILDIDGERIGLFTVLGRSFMGPKVSCPFKTSDRLISQLASDVDHIICEIHAETTSEKESIGWYLDGRVSLVFGTHTHVPTADGRILPKGTAYQTDLGMTGARESVLGRDIEACVGRFLDGMPRKCPVAEKDVGMQGCMIETITERGRFVSNYERIELREEM
ncbi:TIGR00282 family metallophosphoesterase [Opitutales bacterium]|nr:TIGR00282 family metallophosphoesterase [Opitutales bacterium]